MGGKLDGKVADLTGGNSGIGLATAKRFVAEGAYVFITGRRHAELHEAAKQIGENLTASPWVVQVARSFERLASLAHQQEQIHTGGRRQGHRR